MKAQGLRKLTAEMFGTFCLVSAGTGAIVVDEVTGGTVSHVGNAFTFGLIVLAMIYALGNVSSCDLNPAVTLGFSIARRFGGRMVGPYIVSHCIGAILASITIRLMFPTNVMLGATLPAGDALQSWVMECVLTLMLMVVILSVSTGSQEKRILAVGSVIAVEALFAGPA